MSTIEDLLREAHENCDDAGVTSRIGQELQTRSRFVDARRVLERSLALAPDNTDAWAHLAFAAYRSLDDQEGHAILRRGIEATGSDSLKATLCSFCAEDEAGRLRAELEGTTDVDAQATLLSQRFWKGDREEALAGMRALVEQYPEDEGARDNLLWVLLGARNRGFVEGLDLHEEGIPLADLRLAKEPGRMGAWWLKIMMLHAEQDWDGLLQTTGEALARFPDEETVMLFRGRAFREKGDEDRAVGCFQRAIGAKPSFVGARVDLGRLYERQGRKAIAEEVFREIPVANPDYAMGPVSLALFLGREGRWEEAEAVFLATWPKIPAMFQEGFRQNPQAQDLLARDAVREVVGA